MTDHSPAAAAQAVLDATDYPEDWATRIRVAAALRAAALYCKRDSAIVLSLADELEGANG